MPSQRIRLTALVIAILCNTPTKAQYPGYYAIPGLCDNRTYDSNRSLAESYYIYQQAEKQRIRNDSERIELRKKYLDHMKDEFSFKVNFENFKRNVKRASKEEQYSHPGASQEDILSGHALNIQFNFFKERKEQLNSGDSQPIPANCLEHINTCSISKTGGSLGILKHEKLPWTMLFQDEVFRKDRQIVEVGVKELKQQALSGQANFPLAASVLDSIRQLEQTKRNHIERFMLTPYGHEANHFLTDLRKALTDLQEHPRELSIYLRPIEGKTVAEVVHYMQEHGIEFAPAMKGQNLAYKPLYDAFAEEMRRIGVSSK